MPPTGEVLGGILGASGPDADEGRRNAKRIRREAQGRSPALQGAEEPMLEYLLGDDR